MAHCLLAQELETRDKVHARAVSLFEAAVNEEVRLAGRIGIDELALYSDNTLGIFSETEVLGKSRGLGLDVNQKRGVGPVDFAVFLGAGFVGSSR